MSTRAVGLGTRQRLTLMLLVAPVVTVVVGLRSPAAASADACGPDAGVRCPAVERVSPQVFEGRPSGPVTVTVQGSDLARVASVVVEPGGQPETIVSSTDTSLTLRVAPRDLPVGGSVRIGLRLRGGVADVAVTPPIAVIDLSAAPAAPSLQPAPVAAEPSPVAGGAASGGPASVPPPVETSTGGLLRPLVFLLGGLLAGGIGVVIAARRAGCLAHVAWLRRRREGRDHRRAMAEIDYQLGSLWAGGGAAVAAGGRLSPPPDGVPARAPIPPEQLAALRSSLAAALSGRQRPGAVSALPARVSGRRGEPAVTVGQPAGGGPHRSAEAPADPSWPTWSIREQTKPLGGRPGSQRQR